MALRLSRQGIGTLSIRLDSISKRFGEFPALHGLNLDVAPGEFLALLGPSGSGKTTLLRIIAGLEFPDTGSVHFDDAEVTNLPIAQRRIGFVFQQYALFRHMTVEANIAFGLTVRKRRNRPPKAEIAKRVGELLELVQLGGLGGRYPSQLSGGQKQRVALARALAVEPALLLLDEPFGALDAKVRKDLRRWLRDLHERMGLTSIFVTHDQEEALELADRVVVMKQGLIEQIATPHEIYDNPRSAYVFDFVGESNSLPVIVVDGQALFGGEPLGAAADVTGEARLFFRPHDAELVEEGGVALAVQQIHPKGGLLRVEGHVAGIDQIIVIDLPGGTGVTQGTLVRFRPTRSKVYGA
jgi:sulfate/thiosulfate transport system ATP-binding protein